MRILIAGVGNIFFGDDGFGCELARVLAQSELPLGVEVKDYGIRSYDLAFSIMNGYDAVILLDAMEMGAAPGTVSLVQPEVRKAGARSLATGDAHAMNLMGILELLQIADAGAVFSPSKGAQNPGRSGGDRCPPLYLVACEPARLESEELALSPEVRAAVPKAVALVQSLAKFLSLGLEP